MKVEHSDMPNASYIAVPVWSCHAARSGSGSFSPADNPWRRLGIAGIGCLSIRL
jgi:hypothetical protein